MEIECVKLILIVLQIKVYWNGKQVAFAGYPSFACVALPSAVPLSALSPQRLIIVYHIHEHVMPFSCVGQWEPRAGNLRSSRKAKIVVFIPLTSLTWFLVCCQWLHSAAHSTTLNSGTHSFSSLWVQCLPFVARFKMIYFLILLSLRVTSNGSDWIFCLCFYSAFTPLLLLLLGIF